MDKNKKKGIFWILFNAVSFSAANIAIAAIIEKVFPVKRFEIFLDDDPEDENAKTAEEKKQEWKKEQSKNLKLQWFCYIALLIPLTVAGVKVEEDLRKKYGFPSILK